MRVLGIDPGVTGAWAVVDIIEGRPAVRSIGDLPVKTVQMSKRIAKKIEPVELGELLDGILDKWGPDRIVVESLTGAPGITSTTAFSLGWTGGVIDTVLELLGVTTHIKAHPSAWKRKLGTPADKGASRRYATKMFGTDKWWPKEKDHNRAEAAMIAVYGSITKPK